MIGTVEGAGRRRSAVVLGFAAGLLVAAAGLTVVLGALRALLRPSDATATVVFAAGLAVLVVLDWLGVARRLSAGFRVPAVWVRRSGWRAGLVWGLTLGAGFVTEVPYAALQAAVLGAVLLPTPALAWAVPLAYASGRLIVTATPLRHAVLAAADRRIAVARGGSEPLSVVIPAGASRLLLLLLLGWAAAVAVSVA